MKQFAHEWEKLTSDVHILDCVKHCHIEFIQGETPSQKFYPRELRFTQTEKATIDTELKKLLDKKVITHSHHCKGEFISNIFIRPKKSGEGYRLILNLKDLNKSVAYHHFKMDTFLTTIKLVTKGCFMATVDLKDAYYSVPMASEHQKYLKFMFNGKLYQYTCLPNGLGCAPRLFTKLLKPAYSHLRQKGFISSAYIDDCYLQGDTFEDCKKNVELTVDLFQRLGFTINQEKSVVIPQNKAEFLGFVIDSQSMTVTLKRDKIMKLKTLCQSALKQSTWSIQSLAELIGTIVASFPAVQYGQLFYRSLEIAKCEALRQNRGDYSAMMTLNNECRQDLQWWIANVESSNKLICHSPPGITTQSDASLEGWGAVRGEISTGGRWTHEETQRHINYLELLAAFYALKSLCHDSKDVHILMQIDNTTAVAYINNMGGTKSHQCNEISKAIWLWCIQRNIWLTATHLPGSQNILADERSRKFDDQTEWMLNKKIFFKITNVLGEPDIDLFASRLNTQCNTYVSWKPDPDATFVDALSIEWGKLNFYAFPPFSIINRCLQKIQEEEAEGIMITPLWTTQTWYPMLLRMLIRTPILLPLQENLLTLPTKKDCRHPLHKKMRLIACLLSGNPSKTKDFLNQQPTLSCLPGDQVQRLNMTHTLKDGFCSVLKGKLIQFHHL